MLFCIGVSAFRKKSFIKDGICRAENDISLCIVYKVITIILISNNYHQFRIWHKFVGTNFSREEYIGFIDKDKEVQYLGIVLQKDLLRCSLLGTSNRYVIVYISYSCYCKFLLGVW